MSINRRLEKLSQQLGQQPCPECGAGGNIDPSRVQFTLNTSGAPDDAKPCSSCGRTPISFTLNIGELTAGTPAEGSL